MPQLTPNKSSQFQNIRLPLQFRSLFITLPFFTHILCRLCACFLINKSNVVWRCLYSYRQRYSSSQWSKCCGLTRRSRVSPRQILTTVMTNIVVDKSTDNAKPHSLCFLPQYQRQKNFLPQLSKFPRAG